MEILRFLPDDEIPGFDSALLAAQKANEHLCATGGEARCSLWWDVVPKLQNERLGVIGHFQADCPAAGSLVLERAAERLQENDCTLAVGPMDGNTWRRYRVLTERAASNQPFSWNRTIRISGRPLSGRQIFLRSRAIHPRW